MTTLQYIGPHDEVVLGATGAVVARYGTVELLDDALVESLLEQVDNWVEVDVHDGTEARQEHALKAVDDGSREAPGIVGELHEVEGIVGGPPVAITGDGTGEALPPADNDVDPIQPID